MLLTLHFGSRVTHGERFLSVGVAAPAASSAVASADRPALDPAVTAAISTLSSHGLRARPLARNIAALSVEPVAPGTVVDAGALAGLAALDVEIRELSLSRATLPGASTAMAGATASSGAAAADGGLATIASLEHLAHLRLDNVGLTDSALDVLAGMPSVTVLNLHGNPAVTNASIDTIASMPALERVYLWGTGIDADGLAALASRNDRLQVQAAASFPAAIAAAR